MHNTISISLANLLNQFDAEIANANNLHVTTTNIQADINQQIAKSSQIWLNNQKTQPVIQAFQLLHSLFPIIQESSSQPQPDNMANSGSMTVVLQIIKTNNMAKEAFRKYFQNIVTNFHKTIKDIEDFRETIIKDREPLPHTTHPTPNVIRTFLNHTKTTYLHLITNIWQIRTCIIHRTFIWTTTIAHKHSITNTRRLWTTTVTRTFIWTIRMQRNCTTPLRQFWSNIRWTCPIHRRIYPLPLHNTNTTHITHHLHLLQRRKRHSNLHVHFNEYQ